MVFTSDRQRKAFFATGNFGRSPRTPIVMRRNMPKLTKTEREFIAGKIRKNIKEGKPNKQAIAIAFSQARKKFGSRKIPEIKNQRTNVIDKRTRRLLITLIGLSLFLSLFRKIKTT